MGNISAPLDLPPITRCPILLASSGTTAIRNSDGVTDTNWITIASATLPGYALRSNGILRLLAAFTFTGSTSTKQFRTQFGATTTITTNVTGATTLSRNFSTILFNLNSYTSQKYINSADGYGVVNTSAPVTISLDTTQPITIGIQTQWTANSPGEFIQLESYHIEIY